MLKKNNRKSIIEKKIYYMRGIKMEKIKVLLDEETINKRIEELAKQIEKEYRGKEIIFVSILKGSVFFAVDLARKIKWNVKMEFMRVSSYNSGTDSSGEIKLKLDLKDSIQGKDVIIVEDIIDSGRTLSYLIEYLKMKKPNSIKLCTLLDKVDRREVNVNVDYTGFKIPNKFVVGYGLDYDEKYRNLSYVGYIE